ncbi:MAG: TIGR04222 domain-containing membrane protein [Acidobacteria bacterium]|nr:TIGR04222 domain-containing membrane protein [Acidobacteriota bacterium]
MNPFDLRGPEFLLVYGIVAAFVITIAFRIRLWREDLSTKPLPKIEDPYLIAYLRGGSEGAVEAAVVSLIDRQRLALEKQTVVAKSGSNITHPLERAVWKKIKPSTAANAIRYIRCEEEMAEYNGFLLRHGLIPNPEQLQHRRYLNILTTLILLAFGGTKIYIALERGRSNIAFLIFLMAFSVIGGVLLNNPRLTSRGTRALDQLKTLLTNLKQRAGKFRPNQNTQELVLLTALFGVMAVPATAMPLRTAIYPQGVASSGDSGGSSCGSSCGSGCGGGGGCGGCGS